MGIFIEYYGFGLSLGYAKNNESSQIFYYAEPTFSIGFIGKYFDLWLDAGYIIPDKSGFEQIEGQNISLNLNIGAFNFNE